MLTIFSVLLVITSAMIWILLNDTDEIHQIAAAIAGGIALLWLFLLSALTIKVFLLVFMLAFWQRFSPITK